MSMSLLIRSVVIALTIGLGWSASAQAARMSSFGGEDVWLLTASALGSVDVLNGNSNSISTYAFSAGAGHSLGESFELMLFGTYYYQTGTATSTTSVLEVVGQINFVAYGSHAEALYLGGRFGYDMSTSAGVSSSYLLFGGVLGKRFEISGPVSYDPTFSVNFTTSSDGSVGPNYHLVPLQLTLVF